MELCILLSKINNDRQLKIIVLEKGTINKKVYEGTCTTITDEILGYKVLELLAENNTIVIYVAE